MGVVEERDYDNKPVAREKAIEKHFDFRLNGDLDVNNNSSYSSNDNQYGYALFRDELKAQDDCNPDILIEQEGKDNNPHKTKYTDNNNKYLGDDDSGYGGTITLNGTHNINVSSLTGNWEIIEL